MSLAKSPSCEKDVLSDASACPDCGEPVRVSIEEASEGVNPDNPAHICGLLIFGIAILGIIFFAVKSCSG